MNQGFTSGHRRPSSGAEHPGTLRPNFRFTTLGLGHEHDLADRAAGLQRPVGGGRGGQRARRVEQRRQLAGRDRVQRGSLQRPDPAGTALHRAPSAPSNVMPRPATSIVISAVGAPDDQPKTTMRPPAASSPSAWPPVSPPTPSSTTDTPPPSSASRTASGQPASV